jgi:DNA-directed RNA polymerase subunit alpha
MFDIILPRITRTKMQGNAASYEIEPLEPGYGPTIGHSLQRVLLSSLRGAAVTAIQIEGMQDEYQSIPGVKESIPEIAMNVKQIRLRSSSDDPVSMRLEVSGERDVTAADIMTPDTIEVINPETHIATLENEQANLALVMIVEAGRGYVPADTKEDQPIGTIPVDALYTPVLKVSYRVEHTRVGKMVNFDKNVLDITTNGALTPDDALRQSGEILMQQFLMFTAPHMYRPERRTESQSSVLIPEQIYRKPLEVLGLPIRSYNSLKRSGFTMAGQILTQDEADMRKIRNIGDKSLREIEACLRASGCFPPPGDDAVQETENRNT